MPVDDTLWRELLEEVEISRIERLKHAGVVVRRNPLYPFCLALLTVGGVFCMLTIIFA